MVSNGTLKNKIDMDTKPAAQNMAVSMWMSNPILISTNTEQQMVHPYELYRVAWVSYCPDVVGTLTNETSATNQAFQSTDPVSVKNWAETASRWVCGSCEMIHKLGPLSVSSENPQITH